MQMALRYPDFFLAFEDTISGNFSDENNDLMAKIYFSPSATSEEILQFLPTVGQESLRAVIEMALLHLRLPVRHYKLPALVIGGEDDALFPASRLFFNAVPWQANVIRVPRAGHMLPLDHHWQAVATHMLDWMSEQPFQNACRETLAESAHRVAPIIQ